MVVQESAEKLQDGDRAPDFELEGTDGETYSLADFADREALLLVFTCNHCPYAKAKFDVLNGLARDFEEAAVVGINPNDAGEYPEDSFDRMKALVDDGTIDYDAYLRDETQAVAKAYGARCTPDPFLFRREDDEWILAYHGRLDDATNPDETPQEHYVREAIEDILAGESVDLEYMPSRGCSIKWYSEDEGEAEAESEDGDESEADAEGEEDGGESEDGHESEGEAEDEGGDEGESEDGDESEADAESEEGESESEGGPGSEDEAEE